MLILMGISEPQLIQFLSQPWLILPFIAWTSFWKGWALWKAAGKRQLVWFIYKQSLKAWFESDAFKNPALSVREAYNLTFS
ncbi:hypothetical protein CO054_00435 [Candidatus Shapirobacteria bacterium CG_4_9_14_0_2_um_filter_39_11]|uniref:DUF5652 domain-containing protein n=1 Tax=Candidatus Shapirobacteria bacterium CG_4_9_14_0_2_um_filter_39_11 TaxID=1974478 RepID=A0A2M8ETF4_9BACT|nr:MAG: hypothetical protein CO054_00435 [Candidatus Shapirobacteria bacterium CG_4_9_14_0_2_um_filter_39_11]